MRNVIDQYLQIRTLHW